MINSIVCNEDDVAVSGGDDGSLYFWDFTSSHCFQKYQNEAQSGSLASENGIMQMSFDRSGSRLLTCNVDKTIKMFKEDENAFANGDSSNNNTHGSDNNLPAKVFKENF